MHTAPTNTPAHAPTPRAIACPSCGYALDGLLHAGACPECGTRFQVTLVAMQAPKPPSRVMLALGPIVLLPSLAITPFLSDPMAFLIKLLFLTPLLLPFFVVPFIKAIKFRNAARKATGEKHLSVRAALVRERGLRYACYALNVSVGIAAMLVALPLLAIMLLGSLPIP